MLNKHVESLASGKVMWKLCTCRKHYMLPSLDSPDGATGNEGSYENTLEEDTSFADDAPYEDISNIP